MSTPESAAPREQPVHDGSVPLDPVQPGAEAPASEAGTSQAVNGEADVAKSVDALPAGDVDALPAGDAVEAVEHEPIVVETQVAVELRRSVRFGRLLIVGAIVGVVVAALASLSFPIEEGSEYTMAQIVGFMILIGGAIGLCLGGLLALLLSLTVKKQRGGGVAIQTDVR